MLQATSCRSVTDIAYECGIFHLGRFAEAYNLKHRELPSETLRQRRNLRELYCFLSLRGEQLLGLNQEMSAMGQ